MRLRRFKNQDGFTMIESVLALLVFSIGVVGALAISQNMVISAAAGDYRVMAGQLASEKIEQIIADKTFKGYGTIVNGNYPSEPMTGEFVMFTRTTQILEVSTSDYTTASAGSGMKRVTVTVSWTEYAGAKNISVVTLLSSHS